MGVLRSPNIEFCLNDPHVGRYFSAGPLRFGGMNFPVIVTAGDSHTEAVSGALQTVPAHLDTGATSTAIDINLARHMGLDPVGVATVRTAGGIMEFPKFIVNLQFPDSTLSARRNMLICSANLGFDTAKSLTDLNNFGILIGRDVMASWNIVWNGPTSTVIIND